MIQGITSAGLASIFPAAPSPGNYALSDFGSALFALLGTAAAPGLPATASNTDLAAPAKPPGKTIASDPPPPDKDPEHLADEQKTPFDQDTVPVPVPVLVPLPVPMLQQVQVDSAAPTADTKPVFAQETAPVAPFAAVPMPQPVQVDSAAPAAGTKPVFAPETAPVAGVVPLPVPMPQPVQVDSAAPTPETKPVFGQETAPVAGVVPLPVPIPQQVQVDSAAPTPEMKPVFGQETAPVAAGGVPLPAAIPQQVQVDSAAPAVERHSQPVSQPSGGPDMAITQAAHSPAVNATSAASLPSSAGQAAAEIQPNVPKAPQQAAARVKLHSHRADLPHLDDAQKNGTDETAPPPSPRTEPEKTLESVRAEVAQSAASDPRTSTEGNADVRVAPPDVQPASSQGVVSPIPQPGYAQAQPQTSDAPAQPASINQPVILVNPLGKPAFDQAAGGNSGHNPPAGKFPSPALSPSSADHPGGKERGTRATGPGQAQPDAPASNAVKASDQAGAPDAPPAKAQPVPNGSEVLQPQAPRAEVAVRSNASDPSPKPDAPSQAPAHNAAVTNSPLPAERPSQPLFHAAQLVEKVSQSELRLGMRTGEFGNIEIRTSFDHQQVKAEISSERGELGRALSAELPGLEQRMREQDVPLATVVVHDANTGAASSSDRNPRHPQPSPMPLPVGEASGAGFAAAASQPEAWEPEGILNVRI